MKQNVNVQVQFPFLLVLFCIFLVLKLTSVITWSWWWVTAPLWGVPALIAAFFVIVFVGAFLISVGKAIFNSK